MISQEQQVEEYIKCFQDKSRIYFIENYLQTYDATQERDVQFKLFPKQKEFLINVSENTNSIVLKPRQSGYSTVTCAWIAATLVLAPDEKRETAVIVTNKLGMSKDDLSKVRVFLEQTPRWFFGPEYYHPDEDYENANGEKVNKKPIFKRATLEELELFNDCKVYARSSGPNAARGISAASIVMLDEAAFIERGADVAASVIRTTGTVKDKRIIMISTPNLKDELYYKTYHNAELGKNNYKITYLKWYHDPRFNKFLKWWKEVPSVNKKGEEIVKKIWDEDEVLNKNGDVKYDPDRWLELEGDGWRAISPWYISECNSSNNDSIKIAQELECSFLGSGNTAIKPEVIEMQRNKNVSSDYKTDPLYSEMRIWKYPIEGHRYILTADLSRGDAGDNSAIEIMDLDAVDEDTGECYIEQVAEFEGRMTGDIVADICFKYGLIYTNALIVSDNTNGYGEVVSLALVARKYPNIYYGINVQKEYLKDNSKKEFETPQDEKVPGMHIRSQRTFMIAKFIEMLSNNSLRIRSVRTIAEMETWIIKNGKVDHANGCHDDTLIALAMGVYVFENYILKGESQKNKVKTALGLMARDWANSLRDNNSADVNPRNPLVKKPPVGFFTSTVVRKIKEQPKRFYAAPRGSSAEFYTYNPFDPTNKNRF